MRLSLISNLTSQYVFLLRNRKLFHFSKFYICNRGIAFTSEHDQMKDTLRKVFQNMIIWANNGHVICCLWGNWDGRRIVRMPKCCLLSIPKLLYIKWFKCTSFLAWFLFGKFFFTNIWQPTTSYNLLTKKMKHANYCFHFTKSVVLNLLYITDLFRLKPFFFFIILNQGPFE